MATIDIPTLATELGTDARTARKFLRTVKGDTAPGKGHRWAIEKREVRSLKSKFAKHQADEAAAAGITPSELPEGEVMTDAELDAE